MAGDPRAWPGGTGVPVPLAGGIGDIQLALSVAGLSIVIGTTREFGRREVLRCRGVGGQRNDDPDANVRAP